MTKEELENVLNKKCKDIDCIKCLYNRYEKCSAIMAYDILKDAGCLREEITDEKLKNAIDYIECAVNNYTSIGICENIINNFNIVKDHIAQKKEINILVKKTGIHKTATELVKGARFVTIPFKDDDACYTVDNEYENKRCYIPDGYDHYYKDIKEEVDYSDIPVGSIVEFTDKKTNITDVVIVEYIKNEYLHYKRGSFNISSYDLKIIRWGA